MFSDPYMIAWLVPLLPLIGFMINGLFGKSTKNPGAGWLATILVFCSFAITCYLFSLNHAAGEEAKRHAVYLAPWLTGPHFQVNWELLIDPLSLLMMLIITGVGGLIHLYSIGYMANDKYFTRFFTYLNLFLFFMLMLVMGNNMLILFIGWEGVGLCSYLLIGYFFEKQSAGDAAKKAFIMNRIGDVGVLIGMFMLYQAFGTLNFIQGHGLIAGITEPANVAAKLTGGAVTGGFITVMCLMLFFGATGKSAQIPLYTWLPDAMEGPTPVSALIHAATMVTAGVYMVSRMHSSFELSDDAMVVVCVIGVATAILAAFIGLTQNDIKRVLAYSTVSQLGYMFAACGAGVFAAGMFHVMTHAFFKACLFLCSGSVIHAVEHGMHAHGHDAAEDTEHAGHSGHDDAIAVPAGAPDPADPQDMRNMGGLWGKLPITGKAMLAATLAICGIIPFAGYWSKDQILWRLFNDHYHAGEIPSHINLMVFGVGAVTALLTAFYMFRMIMKTFFGAPRTDAARSAHESPMVMTIPLIILAALSFITGWDFPGLHILSFDQFQDFLAPSVVTPGYAPHTAGPGTEHEIAYGMLALIVVVIAVCANRYLSTKNNELVSPQDKANNWLYQLSLNKLYVDEANNVVWVRGGKIVSEWLWKTYDEGVIDGLVNGVASLTAWTGSQLRKLQTGYVRNYAFSMVIGIIFVLVACLAGLGR